MFWSKLIRFRWACKGRWWCRWIRGLWNSASRDGGLSDQRWRAEEMELEVIGFFEDLGIYSVLKMKFLLVSRVFLISSESKQNFIWNKNSKDSRKMQTISNNLSAHRCLSPNTSRKLNVKWMIYLPPVSTLEIVEALLENMKSFTHQFHLHKWMECQNLFFHFFVFSFLLSLFRDMFYGIVKNVWL